VPALGGPAVGIEVLDLRLAGGAGQQAAHGMAHSARLRIGGGETVASGELVVFPEQDRGTGERFAMRMMREVEAPRRVSS